ncbi:MAG: aminotransferase class V-fold PLP-dependent enzyme [Proteobacteria bacterium]|nr:aminotransferase class V-fold PLP-dependent enzyme [Pseudomonadota bacterium]
MSETILTSQRHLFSIPRDLAYFNCAYLAPQLNSASEAAAAAATIKQSPWNVSADDFFAGPEKARGLFADIVGCAAENIALVPAVSYGVAIAGKNLPPGAGQRIVMLAEQFPSNVYSWLALAHERDLVIDFVQKADGRTWSESVLESLDEPAALVALPNVHWTDGSLIDLAPIAKRCHAMGAKLVLDLTQSMGVMRVDIEDLDPDFIFCAAYKWLLCPCGFGFVYVAPRWHNARPLEEAWINRAGSENFAGLVNYRDAYQAGARRFDAGGRGQFQQWPVVIETLRQILEWGVDNIAATVSLTSAKIAAGAARIGLEVPEPHASHLLGIRLSGSPPTDLLGKLRSEGVYLSQRGSRLRIASYLYNDDEDVQRLLAALERHL